MTYTPKILGFAGSTRTDSYNKKLVKVALEGARKAGAEVKFADLRDYAMPLYDGDLEEREGLPVNARKLQDLMIAHDGLLIASPEYNSTFSGVLKNAIDWVSRPSPEQAPLAAFSGKVAIIMSTSPGALGGLRGLVGLRSLLSNIRVIVLPDQIALPKAIEAFNPDGTIKDPQQAASIEQLGATLAETLKKLKA